jgi:hypothetical protein
MNDVLAGITAAVRDATRGMGYWRRPTIRA